MEIHAPEKLLKSATLSDLSFVHTLETEKSASYKCKEVVGVLRVQCIFEIIWINNYKQNDIISAYL